MEIFNDIEIFVTDHTKSILVINWRSSSDENKCFQIKSDALSFGPDARNLSDITLLNKLVKG